MRLALVIVLGLAGCGTSPEHPQAATAAHAADAAAAKLEAPATTPARQVSDEVAVEQQARGPGEIRPSHAHVQPAAQHSKRVLGDYPLDKGAVHLSKECLDDPLAAGCPVGDYPPSKKCLDNPLAKGCM